MTGLTFLAALLPSALLLIYFIKKDRFPEPTHLLVKTFLFGVVSVVPIVILENCILTAVLPLSGTALKPLLTAFVVAGFSEELFKFLILHFFCAKKRDFDEPMDAVVYGVVASLGFACLENVLYVMNGGMWVAVVRSITAVPAHAAMGALMGYFYARQHFGEAQRARLMSKALWVPILAHGIYDVFPMCISDGVVHPTEDVALTLILMSAWVAFIVWLFWSAVAISNEMRNTQSAR